MSKSKPAKPALLSIVLLLCIGKWAVPSFVSTDETVLSTVGRRTALVGALSLAQPGVALARRGGGVAQGGEGKEGGGEDLVTKQAMPSTIEAEEPISEDWKPIDIGESSIVDPDDPKYKNMKLMNEIEKQKARNEEYNSMSAEETRAALLVTVS
eukprot:Skav229467  [mRNA]  locus=scaffold2591:81531:81992:- [translate_table: standard]